MTNIEILESVNIKHKELKEDRPLLLFNILKAMDLARTEQSILSEVGVTFTEKEVQAIEEKAYIAGYIRRARMSNLIADEISEFHASKLYKNWKAFKDKP